MFINIDTQLFFGGGFCERVINANWRALPCFIVMIIITVSNASTSALLEGQSTERGYATAMLNFHACGYNCNLILSSAVSLCIRGRVTVVLVVRRNSWLPGSVTAVSQVFIVVCGNCMSRLKTGLGPGWFTTVLSSVLL